MEARTNHLIISIVILLVSTGICPAQQPIAPTQPPITADFNTAKAVPDFPYIASVMGSNVHIRSGPGTNFYQCGKLNKGDIVTIVDNTDTGWSRIIPPAGAFSWVSMRYVQIDRNNPNIGIITGNNVKVYVGSPLQDPIHSMQSQLTLDRGEVVTLLGEATSDYYKIAPPPGAYRWISTKYTQPIAAPVRRVPPEVIATVVDANNNVVMPTVEPIEPPDSNQQEKLGQYYKLQKLIDAERAKPPVQQNYADIREALTKLADDKQAGNAARYASCALKQIDRFELALKVIKVVALQKAQVEQAKARIDKAVQDRLAEFQQMGRFVVIGRFQVFTIYGPGNYRIIGDAGSTACYALPAGTMVNADLSRYIGKKVGLVGTIEPHKQTAGALVRFTQIVELK